LSITLTNIPQSVLVAPDSTLTILKLLAAI
jgi:hypothetical protein